STPRTVTISNGVVSGLSPGSITFTQNDTSSVHIISGDASNTYNVLDSDLFSSSDALSITGQTTETVNLGNNTNGVRSIFHHVAINNPLSFTPLNANNVADPVGRAVTISGGVISGLAPGQISYPQGDIESVPISGGTGGSTYNLFDTGLSGNRLLS